MSQGSPSDSLFSVLMHSFSEHPRYLLLFVLTLGGLVFSVFSIAMGLLMAVLFRIFHRWPLWMLGGVGLLLVAGMWFFDGISPHLLFSQNRVFFTGIFYHSVLTINKLSWWLMAIPYGLVFGTIMAWISRLDRGVEGKIKRLSKGRSAQRTPLLSTARCEQLLSHLSTSICPGGSILGVDQRTGQTVQLSDTDANLHTLAVGTTGSGKTTGIMNIVESVVGRQFPLFYVDGKGDRALAERLKTYADSKNIPFYLFSMLGESVHYNPIASGGFTSKKDRIVELRHWSEDHYRKLAEGYLQTVFKLLERSQIDVDLILLAAYLEPESLYLLARESGDASMVPEIELLEQHRKDISSLIAEIQNMANSEIGHLLDCSKGPVLTLDKALSERAVVYFCLQPLAFPAYAESLGKLIINDIKSLAASQLLAREPIKLYTIFDEFSVFAGDQIVNLINQGRSAGVHAVLSTQSLSDIERKGGEALLGQILNNCNNYLIQRQNNPGDAEILANVIGTCDSFQITSQVATGAGGTGLGSIRETKEFIIHPDEIKRLARGQAVFVNKQDFRVQRVQLRKGRI